MTLFERFVDVVIDVLAHVAVKIDRIADVAEAAEQRHAGPYRTPWQPPVVVHMPPGGPSPEQLETMKRLIHRLEQMQEQTKGMRAESSEVARVLERVQALISKRDGRWN